jgi:hypothetical protein
LQLGVLLPQLNERQQRLALASEARLLVHGGVRAVAHAASLFPGCLKVRGDGSWRRADPGRHPVALRTSELFILAVQAARR